MTRWLRHSARGGEKACTQPQQAPSLFFVPLVCFFNFWAIPQQCLRFPPDSELRKSLLVDSLRKPYWMLGIEFELAFKGNALPIVLSLVPSLGLAAVHKPLTHPNVVP